MLLLLLPQTTDHALQGLQQSPSLLPASRYRRCPNTNHIARLAHADASTPPPPPGKIHTHTSCTSIHTSDLPNTPHPEDTHNCVEHTHNLSVAPPPTQLSPHTCPPPKHTQTAPPYSAMLMLLPGPPPPCPMLLMLVGAYDTPAAARLLLGTLSTMYTDATLSLLAAPRYKL